MAAEPVPQGGPTPPVDPLAEAMAAGEMSSMGRAGHRALRAGLGQVLKVWFRASVRGLEHIPDEGGFVLAPGAHRSIIDMPLVTMCGSRIPRYMGAENYFQIPVFGRFLRTMGGFPVERSMTDRKAVRLAEEVLRRGEPLVIFPEGTRLTGPTIDQMKDGAGFLACRAEVPIIPVGIGGAARAMPIGARWPRPTKVAMIIGEPIVPPARNGQRVKRSTVKAVNDELRQRLQNLFDQAQADVGAS